MAALCEVKQHLAVHLAAHINDSSVCVRVHMHTCMQLQQLVRAGCFFFLYKPRCIKLQSELTSGGVRVRARPCTPSEKPNAGRLFFVESVREVDKVKCECVPAPVWDVRYGVGGREGERGRWEMGRGGGRRGVQQR